jgi:tetraacyldisaccharide 4'-kinase
VRSRLQDFAYRWWDGQFGVLGGALMTLLAPVSAIWSWTARRRARRYTGGAGIRLPRFAVVSIGNLAVGGTGKTPFSSWVARTLAESGAVPGLVLNGYGPDEEKLHREWTPDIRVESDRDRVAAARRVQGHGCDVAVLDDGFQHQRLGRDLDIVLIGVEDRFPGRVLPCGPYREPESALARADMVVFTRRWAPLEAVPSLEAAVRGVAGVRPDVVTACLRLAPNRVVALSESPGAPGGAATLAQVAELGPPVVLTAIARPRALLAEVKVVSLRADLIAFEDHHEFTEREVRRARKRAGSRPLVITEKDAVKLRAFAALLPNTWILAQTLSWDWGEEVVRAALEEVRYR